MLLIETVGELPSAPEGLPFVSDPRDLFANLKSPIFPHFLRRSRIIVPPESRLSAHEALKIGSAHMDLISDMVGVDMIPCKIVSPNAELREEFSGSANSDTCAILGAVVPVVRPNQYYPNGRPDLRVPKQLLESVKSGFEKYTQHCISSESFCIFDSGIQQLMYGQISDSDEPTKLYYVDTETVLGFSTNQ